MGAEAFEDYSDLEDVNVAFDEVVEDARYEYGHGGYTGTIAEKSDYTIFKVPEGHTAEEALEALQSSYDGRRPEWIPKNIVEIYNDKWGDAIAIKNGVGWIFCGWASS